MSYCLDIETLSTNQPAVVLSIGIIYIPDAEPKTYQEIRKHSLFLKLDATYQIETLKREANRSTIDWWLKQDPEVRDNNFKRKPDDLSPLDAIIKLRAFILEHTGNSKELCYTRGAMDSIVIEHLCEQLETPPPFAYFQYRDVRTAIDIIYPGSKNGYVDVDPNRCYNFNRDEVKKHDPVEDAQLDIAMLLYGKNE